MAPHDKRLGRQAGGQRPTADVVRETAPRVASLTAEFFLAEAEKAAVAAENEGAASGEKELATLRLVYRPMWDVRRNALATYICVPAADAVGGTAMAGEAAIPGFDNPKMAFELDKLVLQRVIQDLWVLQSTGRKLLLIAPVHFETLASGHRRQEYIRWCKAIPEESRKLVIFELVAAPDSIPAGRLSGLAAQLRSYSRAVILRTSVTSSQVYPPWETGIFAIGADLSGSDRREGELMKDMNRFVAAAAKSSLKCYVHGSGSVSLTTAAVGAGFDYIDGDVITTVVDAPVDGYHFEARNIYANPYRHDATPSSGTKVR